MMDCIRVTACHTRYGAPLSSAEDGGAFICLRSGSKAMNLRAVAIKKDA